MSFVLFDEQTRTELLEKLSKSDRKAVDGLIESYVKDPSMNLFNASLSLTPAGQALLYGLVKYHLEGRSRRRSPS